MNREDVIRMARDAHRDLVALDYPGHIGQLNPWIMRLLERFAALVAAHEREACAKVAETHQYVGWGVVAAAIRARAAAIRARGQEDKT